MMIPRETEQEKARATTSSCSRVKDPRIVLVSRGMGGKDRHSKVCTVRGLRDRRVRLSVQTAIQLYDLQERLGLNQPSKVVDWLLDAAKHEIHELPPLQIPQPTTFTHLLLPPQTNQHHNHLMMSSYTPFPSNLNLSQPPLTEDQDFVYHSAITHPYFTSDLSTSSLTAPMDHRTHFSKTADLLASQNNAAKRDHLHFS